MLLTGLRWDDLGWRDQLDIVEAVLGEGAGVDANLDHVDDQIMKMFPDETTWGSSPVARRAQAAAEATFQELPHVGQPKKAPARAAPPSPPKVAPAKQERVPFIRSGVPLEAGLFYFMQRTLMGIPRPPVPPTITPDA